MYSDKAEIIEKVKVMTDDDLIIALKDDYPIYSQEFLEEIKNEINKRSITMPDFAHLKSDSITNKNENVENYSEINVGVEEKYIKYALIASIISAVVTLVYSFIGTYNETINYKYGVDTWGLLDVAIITGLSYGIYKKNRFCTLSMLIYFLVSKFIMFANSGNFIGSALTIVFVICFFRGTVASFRHHKYRIEVGDIKKKKRGIGFILKVSVLIVVISVISFFIIVVAIGPDTSVIPGKYLKKEYVEFMKQEKLISPGEQIDYWYSDALVDFKSGFYFLTNKKVVIYSSDFYEPAIIIPYSDIVDIQVNQSLSTYENSEIILILKNGSSAFFPLSIENNMDRLFVQKLKDNYEKMQGSKSQDQRYNIVKEI